MTSINDFKVTRLPGGLSTNEIQQNMGQYPLPDITKVHTLFDDFDNAESLPPSGNKWKFFESDAAAARVIEATDGGYVLLTNTVGASDINMIFQQPSTYVIETGNQFWFKTTIEVSDSDLQSVFIGLQNSNTDPVNADDGVFFRKLSGESTLKMVVRNTDVESTVDVLEMVDDTEYVVGFDFNGDDKITVFSNNESIAKIGVDSLPSAILRPIIAQQNGEGVAGKTMQSDYIFVSKSR